MISEWDLHDASTFEPLVAQSFLHCIEELC